MVHPAGFEPAHAPGLSRLPLPIGLRMRWLDRRALRQKREWRRASHTGDCSRSTVELLPDHRGDRSRTDNLAHIRRVRPCRRSTLPFWWTRRDLNPLPPQCDCGALPIALQARWKISMGACESCGRVSPCGVAPGLAPGACTFKACCSTDELCVRPHSWSTPSCLGAARRPRTGSHLFTGQSHVQFVLERQWRR